MQFTLNGQRIDYSGDPDLPLLTYLRDEQGIISPKDGCAPQAACGCCTVQIDAKAMLACVTPMKKVDDKHVITTEGMSEYRQEVFAEAFRQKGGLQCGFCIPGIVMRANALIDKNPTPTRDDITKSLTMHLCRCTGYTKIIDSIDCAATTIHNEETLPTTNGTGAVGTRHPKYEARALALGQREYVDDMTLPGMVHGALKFSDYPRAIVKQIDASKALALDGVIQVVTAGDIPGDRYIGLIRQDWAMMIAEGETTRYVGDVLAGVIAETDAIARQAVDLIEVDYEVLEPVTDPHLAMQEDAPPIHEGGNVLSETIINRGNWDTQYQQTAYTATGTFQTQRIEHGFLEPECAIATPEDHGITLYSQGQGVFEDRKQVAKLLDVPLESVRVILVPNGGGFGGKEDLSVQGHAAVMAQLVGKPVKVRLTRDESIAMHPKRHPIWMEYEIGCDANGRFTYCKAHFVGDTGAYASVGMKVLERSAGHATGAYNFPAADIHAIAVYTNNVPCGAMRGFGVNQAAFGLESCIDELCEQGGFDRWQFRYDNALQDGDMTSTGQVLASGIGIRATLEAVKDAFYDAPYAGIACGIKNTGVGNGMADAAKVRITIVSDEEVMIDHGWTEMGQGIHTMAIQALVSETGINPNIVTVRTDTAFEQHAGMTTASRATSLVGNAVINACTQLKEDLATHSLADLSGRSYQGEWICDWTTKPGADVKEIKTHYSYSYATQLVVLDEAGEINKIVAAHDAGKIFNPMLFEGQIEGSVHMGLGYAISEDLPMEDGYLKSTRLRDCGILRAKEMPEIEVIGVEVPDEYGPYGAKGVGEIGLVPTAAAVANAYYQFDGIRRRSLPMTNGKRR